MTYRNHELLDLARHAPKCMGCGRYNCGQVVAAHRNESKGMGSKAADYMWAALCDECHTNYDQGKDETREEKRAFWMRAFWATQEWLWTSGHVAAHAVPVAQPMPKPKSKAKIRSSKTIPSRGFEKPTEKKPWPKRSFPKRGA